MHDLACSGKLTFQQAEAAVATNWLTAYEKYLGPLPGGVKSSQFTVGSTLPSAAGTATSGATGAPAGAAVAGNWLAAYEKYLGPLPGGVKSSQFTVGLTLPSAAGAAAAGATGAAAGAAVVGMPASGGDCPADKPIKGSRSHIYHLQNDPNYKATKPVACFASEADAQAAGYRAPKR